MSPDWHSRSIATQEGGDPGLDPVTPDHNLDAVLSHNTYCRLDHWGVLGVRGAEASSFLQGQITQDIQRIRPTRSHLAAHCTPKGRMLALFRIVHHDTGYRLLLPREQLPALHQRLRMFVLRARVDLSDDSDNCLCVGLGGPDAEALLARLYLLPGDVDQVTVNAGLRLLRLAGVSPRFLLLGEPERVATVMAELTPAFTPVGTDAWRLLDILAGIPSVYPQTADQFVPQMANLDSLGGISFQKGCYTGQEIVARSHYLGKLKRRMFRLHLASGHARPGMAVMSEADPDQPAGTVVDAAPHPAGGEALLAVLRLEMAQTRLRLKDADGPPLHPANLPYALS